MWGLAAQRGVVALGCECPPAADFRGPPPHLGRLLLDFAPKGNHATLQTPRWAGRKSVAAVGTSLKSRYEPPGWGRCSLGVGGRPLWRNQGGGGPPRPEWRRHPCRRGTFATRASRPRRGGRRKWRSRPVSRVLSWTVIPLGASSPIRSSNLPGPDAGRVMRSLFGLAPGGVCRAGLLPGSRCALTAPFHPCHALPEEPFGGLLSVALSVGSRRPGVTWHRALWSPDFPRHSEE